MYDKKMALEKAAHDIFYEKGYKDTNISEITNRAGMAIGSFYKYYSSKEDIFLAIYIQENERIKKEIINKIDWSEKPSQVVHNFLGYISIELSHNAILAEWYNKNISSLLHNYYYSDEGKNNYFFYQFSEKVLRNWIKEKKCSKKNIQNGMDILNAIYYLDSHVNEIGLTNYPESINQLVEYLIKGMFPD